MLALAWVPPLDDVAVRRFIDVAHHHADPAAQLLRAPAPHRAAPHDYETDNTRLCKALEVYERLPGEIQAELPLRRIWTLVPEDAD
jgi:hypothetical protein